jgi:hypothetical protein
MLNIYSCLFFFSIQKINDEEINFDGIQTRSRTVRNKRTKNDITIKRIKQRVIFLTYL